MSPGIPGTQPAHGNCMQDSGLQGSCHCGNISLRVSLPPGSPALVPRCCNCGYCTRQGAAWISHAAGRLEIDIADATAVRCYRQGSNQADLVFCLGCGTLTHVCTEEDGRILAAVNSRVFDVTTALAASQSVSPQELDAAAKMQRWRQLWFGQVVVRNMWSRQDAGRPGEQN